MLQCCPVHIAANFRDCKYKYIPNCTKYIITVVAAVAFLTLDLFPLAFSLEDGQLTIPNPQGTGSLVAGFAEVSRGQSFKKARQFQPAFEQSPFLPLLKLHPVVRAFF